MKSMQAQLITNSMPSPLWFYRWGVHRQILYYLIAGVAYLANVLSTGQLTPVRFLLLTMTYGAWMGIFHIGRRNGGRLRFWWICALFCLACMSQFIPLSNTNLDWLPILPTATACLIVAIIPSYLGLIAAGMLYLSSSLAFAFNMHIWDLNSQMTLLFSFVSFVGFTAAMRELTLAHIALANSNDELAIAHTQLQEYSAQVEEIAAIRERNRIAREIHDTLGHSLTLLAVQLEAAMKFEERGDPSLHDELLEARRVARACLTDVRHSVEELRPDNSSSGSLQEQLRRLVAEFAATCHETAITLDLDEVAHPLNPDHSMTLYRCAQEALTNIRKHAHATKVLLCLNTSDEPEMQVELTVLDNGRGFISGYDGQSPGFGLRGMGERVALMGGTMRAGPEPEHGWRVAVTIPLSPPGQIKGSARTSRDTKKERELWQSQSGC
jgi:signal transduction histidine kinase